MVPYIIILKSGAQLIIECNVDLVKSFADAMAKANERSIFSCSSGSVIRFSEIAAVMNRSDPSLMREATQNEIESGLLGQ